MAKVNQKDRYRQRASLCYEIAATMFGDKATSMKRLGDIYAGLIEDFDKSRTDGFVITGKNVRPNSPAKPPALPERIEAVLQLRE